MRRVIGAGIALVFVLGGALYLRSQTHAPLVTSADAPGVVTAARPSLPPPASSVSPLPPLMGLDLAHIAVDDEGSTAPVAARRTAHLTVEPGLQRTAVALMQAHHLPEGAIVLIDVASGHVLAYASHMEARPGSADAERRDLCSEATAPAASVFKIITGAALVENAGLGPDTKQCYSGGEQKILPSDLEDDPNRDRWCTTLTGAMGHSTNAVFARLALKTLKPATLEEMAAKFGFNEPVPFDGPTEASALHLPTDNLGYARTAAGFWNSTLSPIEAAYMSTIVARGGDAAHLSIVDHVTDEKGATTYAAPQALASHRAIARDTATALTTMMENTVREGTSYRAFHDHRGTSFLPGIVVAGKTGTLTDAQEQRFYTWFTGFAPAKPIPGVRQVAVAVLVVNHPTWHVKANVIAREILREHFAREKVPNVSRPRAMPVPVQADVAVVKPTIPAKNGSGSIARRE